MKKVVLSLIVLVAFVFNTNAQKLISSEWYQPKHHMEIEGHVQFNWLSFFMKDTMAKIVDENWNIERNSFLSMGGVLDLRDPIYENGSNGYGRTIEKVSKFDSIVVDSVNIIYNYTRHTDSFKVGNNPKKPVVDTLIVSWYTSKELITFRFSNFNNNNKYVVPRGQWDTIRFTQEGVFKKDTIFLTNKDSVLLFQGREDMGWNYKKMSLKVPNNFSSSYSDTNKILAYTLQFRSGVPGADTGIMLFRQDPANYPSGVPRPNIFGVSNAYETNFNDHGEYSYNGALILAKPYAFSRTSGILGYYHSNAYTSLTVIPHTDYFVRTFLNPNLGLYYTVSDTTVCKGDTVTFNLTDCNLFSGNQKLGTGIIHLIPEANTQYSIVRFGEVISRVTIRITDSLNHTSLSGSDTVRVCGISSKFELGVRSSVPRAISYRWFRNDTLLSNSNPIDSFIQAGSYRVVATTSNGCRNDNFFNVIKYNNDFNPDFSVNTQSLTAPPFNFTFANNTSSINNYDFTWKWGDGNSTVNNNLINFYTYSFNGLYTVTLVAEDKQTKCKDSLVKTNFITCSGGNNASLGFSINRNSPSCYGNSNGSIILTVQGGVAPYQYRLNNGNFQSSNTFSNLVAGVYTIEVKDASNNTLSKVDSLLNPPKILVGSINGSNGVAIASLENYNIAPQLGALYGWNIINGTLLSGNGTNSIVVQWASLSGLGKVIANVNINGCWASDTLNIAIGSSPLNFTTALTNESCIGSLNGRIEVLANGGNPPYQYSINNNSFQTSNIFPNLQAGIYTVKVKDALGIIFQDFDTLFAGQGITVGPMNGPVNVATGALETYIVGQQVGHSYTWEIKNGIVASGQGTNIAQISWNSSPAMGEVKVKATSQQGCKDSSVLSVNIGNFNSVNVITILDVKVYPNPTDNMLHLSYTLSQAEEIKCIILDIQGKKVSEVNLGKQTAGEQKQSISLKDLPAGSYTVQIQGQQFSIHKQIVKQ